MMSTRSSVRPTRPYWLYWKKVNEDRVKRMMNKEQKTNRQIEQMMKKLAK